MDSSVNKWYRVDHQGNSVVGQCYMSTPTMCSFRTAGGKVFHALRIDVAEEVPTPASLAPKVTLEKGQLVRWNGQLSVVEHLDNAGRPWVSTLEGDDFTGQVLASQCKPQRIQEITAYGDAATTRYMARNDAVAAGAYMGQALGRGEPRGALRLANDLKSEAPAGWDKIEGGAETGGAE